MTGLSTVMMRIAAGYRLFQPIAAVHRAESFFHCNVRDGRTRATQPGQFTQRQCIQAANSG